MGFNSGFKGLNVSGDNAEVWCVPSATHVPCRSRGQDDAVGIGMFVTLLSGTLL